MRTSKPVGVSNGKSIEFFLIETVDRLEVVREVTAGGWTAGPFQCYVAYKKSIKVFLQKDLKK